MESIACILTCASRSLLYIAGHLSIAAAFGGPQGDHNLSVQTDFTVLSSAYAFTVTHAWYQSKITVS